MKILFISIALLINLIGLAGTIFHGVKIIKGRNKFRTRQDYIQALISQILVAAVIIAVAVVLIIQIQKSIPCLSYERPEVNHNATDPGPDAVVRYPAPPDSFMIAPNDTIQVDTFYTEP